MDVQLTILTCYFTIIIFPVQQLFVMGKLVLSLKLNSLRVSCYNFSTWSKKRTKTFPNILTFSCSLWHSLGISEFFKCIGTQSPQDIESQAKIFDRLDDKKYFWHDMSVLVFCLSSSHDKLHKQQNGSQCWQLSYNDGKSRWFLLLPF